MHISVVIPTFNRLPILKKCLAALEKQKLPDVISDYEVIVVDDGSNDGTINWLKDNEELFPHISLIEIEHGGPGLARNIGVQKSSGDVIVFIDSDLVVTPSFLGVHAQTLKSAWQRRGDKYCFTYGAVINTSNFQSPTSEKYKFTDLSWAYFATGNVAIDKGLLQKAGLFDPSFRLYGWEDLELGERLRNLGVEIIKCHKAVGYHWHPALTLAQIPDLIRVEKERAKMAIVFFRKHPTIRVRLIIQYTRLHLYLWEILTFGGILNPNTLRPLLRVLLKRGYPRLAMEILRIPLNLISVRAIYKEATLHHLR